MRLKPLTVLVAVLLLGAAGCAGSAGGAAGSETGGARTDRTSTPRGEPIPVAPAIEPDPVPGEARIQPGEPLPAERVDTSALPRNYPRKVNLASGGDVLAVVARESDCGQAAVEIVEQNARRVVLLLTEITAARAGPCTSDIRLPTVTARLDEPLGNRTVELRFEER